MARLRRRHPIRGLSAGFHAQLNMQSSSTGDVHERIEAELIDATFEKRIQPRLCEPKEGGGPSLRQAAARNEKLNLDHDLGS